MTFEIAVVLGIVAVTIVLFVVEWWPVEMVALAAVAALMLSGVLTPPEALSGFASEVLIVLASLFVFTRVLTKSGAMDWLGALLYRVGGRNPLRAMAAVMTLSATLSAFFSNTSATGVLIPAAGELSRRSGVDLRRLLLPLAFASMLGGTCTIIGTSTNLAASGLLESLGIPPFGIFEFAGVGGILAALGIAYLLVIGDRLIGESPAGPLTGRYQVREYLSSLHVTEDSPMAGQTIKGAGLEALDVTPLRVDRPEEKLSPDPRRKLQVGDTIVVRSTPEALIRAARQTKLSLSAPGEDPGKQGGAEILMEAVVMPGSGFLDRPVRRLDLPGRFSVSVLALHRRGQAYPAEVDAMRLAVGDVLLLQGSQEDLEAIRSEEDFLCLSEELPPLPGRPPALAPVLLLAAAVLVTAMEWAPISVAFLVSSLTLVIGGFIRMEEVYRHIGWRVLILIGSMTGFGVAMSQSGAAEFLAGLIVHLTSGWGPHATLAGLAVMTVVLTQPMSNAAAVLVMLPVATETAGLAGVDPRTFAVGVTLSASLSFITPLEPACLLVFGPGKYRFLDFARVGAPLTTLAIAILVFLVPWIWGW